MFKGTAHPDGDMFEMRSASYGRLCVKEAVFCDKTLYRSTDPRFIVDRECDCYEEIVWNPGSDWYRRLACKHSNESGPDTNWRLCLHPRGREMAVEQDCELELSKKLEDI